jgi:hypothetical protein
MRLIRHTCPPAARAVDTSAGGVAGALGVAGAHAHEDEDAEGVGGEV